jgi:hypothetical protein
MYEALMTRQPSKFVVANHLPTRMVASGSFYSILEAAREFSKGSVLRIEYFRKGVNETEPFMVESYQSCN